MTLFKPKHGAAFPHRDLTGIAPLSADDIITILNLADDYAGRMARGHFQSELLRGKIILTLFFEDSTRTRTSFEIAAKRLGADIVHWNPETSSLNKGETFRDTITTLAAMKPDAIIVRHKEYGAPLTIAEMADCPVINAGDSWREHPTQALLDARMMRAVKGNIAKLTIAIIGDIAHSRVAASNMILLNKLGARVNIIAPDVLMPDKLPAGGVEKFTSLKDGLAGADIVMTIRPQKERMQSALIEDASYFRDYGMTHDALSHAKPDALVMDPGPFLRGVQISDELADDPKRFIYHAQVEGGVPTRMAVYDLLMRDR